MKTFKRTGLFLSVAAAVAASNAMAAGSFQSITSEAVSVEFASTGSATANISGDAIVLSPQVGYTNGAGARLVLTLTNGATFSDASYTLEESSGGAGTGDLTHWTQAPSSTSTSLEFILGTSTVSPGDKFLLSGSSIAGQAVNMTLPSLAAGGEIDIDAQYKDSPTTVVEEYTSLELFQYFNEFSASLDTSANGVVDVADDRLSFTGGVDNDVISIDFINAPLTNNVALDDDDKVIITLSGDMSGISTIAASTDGTARGNMTIDTSANTASMSLSASDVFASSGSTVLTATVDGTSALATRTFTAQADLDFVDETDKNLVAQATAAGEWTINGLQAKVSHLSLNATGFISWLKVVNEGNTAAEISADIIWTLADGSEGSVTAADLGSVDAGGIATISEASILAAMGDPTQLVDASMIVTVAGQTNAIHLVAEKKASDGRLPVPVYYDTTSRNWLQ